MHDNVELSYLYRVVGSTVSVPSAFLIIDEQFLYDVSVNSIATFEAGITVPSSSRSILYAK